MKEVLQEAFGMIVFVVFIFTSCYTIGKLDLYLQKRHNERKRLKDNKRKKGNKSL